MGKSASSKVNMLRNLPVAACCRQAVLAGETKRISETPSTLSISTPPCRSKGSASRDPRLYLTERGMESQPSCKLTTHTHTHACHWFDAHCPNCAQLTNYRSMSVGNRLRIGHGLKLAIAHLCIPHELASSRALGDVEHSMRSWQESSPL